MYKRLIKPLAIAVVERAYANRKIRDHILRLQKGNGYLMVREMEDHKIAFEYFDYIGRCIFNDGQYQRPLMHATINYLREKQLLKTGGTMIEVGANIGSHTIYAGLEHDFERIICLEPDPRSFRYLELNISINKLNAKVTALRLAAGAENSRLKFKQEVRNRGFSRIIPDHKSDEDSLEVEVVKLDELLEKETVLSDDINLFWIDVEGFELSVLKGMDDVLQSRPSICVEFSPSLYDESTLNQMVDLIFSVYPKVQMFIDGKFSVVDRTYLKASGQKADLLLTRA